MLSPRKQDEVNQQVTSSLANAAPVDKGTQLNLATRWIENAKLTGGIVQAAVYYQDQHSHPDGISDEDLNLELQAGVQIQNISGLLIGLILHYLFKSNYSSKKSLNPFYRNFKTLASLGASIGMVLANLVPFIPQTAQKYFIAIFANVFGLAVGLLAIPYWLIKRYSLTNTKAANNEKDKIGNNHALTGREGWSKYAKTFLVFGICIGQLSGAIYAYIAGISLSMSMILAGGMVGVASCLIGMALVPLINRLCHKALVSAENDKDTFRNNYVRSGITAGTGLGATIGFFVGTFLFPGIGSIAGMILGGAIGGITGGITLGFVGKKISLALQKHWSVSNDSENSWDYATRNTSYACSFLFAAIGFFLPVPGGALVGAALGAAIGNALGWAVGFAVIKLARNTVREEPKALTLPWTQRVASGATVSSMIGSGIGFCLGLLGGPIGAVGGAALGAAIGGVIGVIAGALYDPVARSVMRHTILPSTSAIIYQTLPNEADNLNQPDFSPITTPIPKTPPLSIRSRSLSSLSSSSKSNQRNNSPEVSSPSSPRRASWSPGFDFSANLPSNQATKENIKRHLRSSMTMSGA